MFKIIKYYFFTAIVLTNMALIAFAQDTKHDVNIDVDVKGAQWYNQWWIWGLMAMLFIITIVALMTRSRRAAD